MRPGHSAIEGGLGLAKAAAGGERTLGCEHLEKGVLQCMREGVLSDSASLGCFKTFLCSCLAPRLGMGWDARSGLREREFVRQSHRLSPCSLTPRHLKRVAPPLVPVPARPRLVASCRGMPWHAVPCVGLRAFFRP